MFKAQLKNLFTEGLGDIFFMKYYRFLGKHITNKYMRGFLVFIHAVVYLAFLVLVGYILFELSYPLK